MPKIPDYYDVPSSVNRAYAEQLYQHIGYVVQAGEWLGLSKTQVAQHDSSKWLEDEFPGYALHFFGGGDPVAFTSAWHLHLHRNPHHWQYWLKPYGDPLLNNGVKNGTLEMPEDCVYEMVADWMGSSKTYTNSWDMTDWLTKNLPKVILHPKSREVLINVLTVVGYSGALVNNLFQGEYTLG